MRAVVYFMSEKIELQFSRFLGPDSFVRVNVMVAFMGNSRFMFHFDKTDAKMPLSFSTYLDKKYSRHIFIR